MRTALVALLMVGCWSSSSKQPAKPEVAPAAQTTPTPTPEPSEPVAEAPAPAPDEPATTLTGGSDLGGPPLGSPAAGMRGRPAAVPTVSIGQLTATNDSLDKAIIRRYIKRNIQKLAYCYEKQLLSDPKLAGDVIAKFTINADGRVTGSTASGLHANVDSCVAKVIGAIEFPKPQNGNSLDVTYPFTYRPANTAVP